MRHPLGTLLAVLVVSLVVLVLVLWNHQPERGFLDALMTVLPSFLGEISGDSPDAVRTAVVLLGLIASVGMLAILTALIVNRFIQFCQQGGIILHEVNLKRHIVICGWNSQGELIVQDLLNADSKLRGRVVILADLEKHPLEDDRILFLRGDPSRSADLERANVQEADSAIVLTDFTVGAREADGKALLCVLAVETLNRDVHTCVQIMDSANREHFARAHADEIICLQQLGGYLAVASALNHGTSQLVSELLAFNDGSEFYRYSRSLPEYLAGKSFAEAVQSLGERQVILVGVETVRNASDEELFPGSVWRKEESEVHTACRFFAVNPPGTYTLEPNDTLFVIAKDRPEQL